MKYLGDEKMAKVTNQNQSKKKQSNLNEQRSISKPSKSSSSGNAGSSERFRKGSAGDTNNTGPRRK
jgi:hypothetical protein